MNRYPCRVARRRWNSGRLAILPLLTVLLSVGALQCPSADGGEQGGDAYKAIEPAPPTTGEIPAEMKADFDKEFGEKIRAARLTPAIEDDAKLVVAILNRADALGGSASGLSGFGTQPVSQPGQDPEAAAYYQDQAIVLGGMIPELQESVYNVLRSQRHAGYRDPTACLERMMIVGPRIGATMDQNDFILFCLHDFRPDMLQLASRRVYAMATAAAAEPIEVYLKATPRDGDAKPLREAVAELQAAGTREAGYAATAAKGEADLDAQVYAALKALAAGDTETGGKALGDSKNAQAAALGAVIGGGTDPSADNKDKATEAMLAVATAIKDPLLRCRWLVASGDLLGTAKFWKAFAFSPGPRDVRRGRPEEVRDFQFRPSSSGGRDKLADRLATEVKALHPVLTALIENRVRDVVPAIASRQVEFYGLGRKNVAKVVYVIDNSGSMTDAVMYVRHELRRSLAALGRGQQFQVILFGDKTTAAGDGTLLAATNENRATADKFLGAAMTTGSQPPADALKKALDLNPGVIYFLSDGPVSKETVMMVRKAKDTKIPIYTVCFIYTEGEAAMMEIAHQTDGEYKYIGEDDLQNLGL